MSGPWDCVCHGPGHTPMKPAQPIPSRSSQSDARLGQMNVTSVFSFFIWSLGAQLGETASRTRRNISRREPVRRSRFQSVRVKAASPQRHRRQVPACKEGSHPRESASRSEAECAPARAPRDSAGGGEAAAATQRNPSEASDQL